MPDCTCPPDAQFHTSDCPLWIHADDNAVAMIADALYQAGYLGDRNVIARRLVAVLGLTVEHQLGTLPRGWAATPSVHMQRSTLITRERLIGPWRDKP